MTFEQSDIVIRRADPSSSSDIERICQVGGEAYKATFSWQGSAEDMEHEMSNTWGYANIQAALESGTSPTWVADHPVHGVIGLVTARTNNPETLTINPSYPHPVELQRLYIGVKHHGGGIGRRLVTVVHEWAKEQGYKSIWLGVAEENAAARRLYGKMGYQWIGEHPFTWSSGRVDTDQVMARTL